MIEADDARQSFAKNFVSKGMKILLSHGLKPLPCRSDQGVFDYFDNAIT